MNDEIELGQAGFDAISEKMKQLYPGQDGTYYGTIIPYSLGGGDPLDGVEVWESERGVPHWHYITYGFSELYEKENDTPDDFPPETQRRRTAPFLARQPSAKSGTLYIFQRKCFFLRTLH